MKRLLSVLALSLITLCSSAKPLQFGVRGGLNISDESSHKYLSGISNSTKFRQGFNLGGVVNMPITEKFHAEADVMYSMQGFKQDILTTTLDEYDEVVLQTITSHYLNIPIVAKYYVANGLYVECGPQVGFLLGRTNNAKDLMLYDDPYEYSKSKKVDFSIVAGLGYNFYDNFYVNARYCHGFTGTSQIYDGGKNRNIQISVGYMFAR